MKAIDCFWKRDENIQQESWHYFKLAAWEMLCWRDTNAAVIFLLHKNYWHSGCFNLVKFITVLTSLHGNQAAETHVFKSLSIADEHICSLAAGSCNVAVGHLEVNLKCQTEKTSWAALFLYFQRRVPDVIGIGIRKCGTGVYINFLKETLVFRTPTWHNNETEYFSNNRHLGLEWYK